MNFKEYTKLHECLNEGKKKKHILTSRRSKEERAKNKLIADKQKVKQYIKNGSKGDFDVEKFGLTEIPSNLKIVGGDLYLTYSGVTEIPSGLKEIKGSLYMNKCNITTLPDNLKVGKDLNAVHSIIKHLPKNLKVGRDLILASTYITNITQLSNLYVGGHLNLCNTNIESIHPSLVVKKTLFLGETSFAEKYTLEEIQKMLPNVNNIETVLGRDQKYQH